MGEFLPNQRVRKLLRLLAILSVVGLIVLAVLYLLYGEQLGGALYQGRIEHLPGALLAGRDAMTASEFQSWLDELFWVRLILGVPLTALFYFGLFKLTASLIQRQDNDALADALGEPQRLRCDWLIALATYTALTLAFFAPTLPTLTTRMIGPPEDNMQFLWNIWWVGKVLLSGQGSLMFSPMLFAPQGGSLLYHSMTLANTIPGALLVDTLSYATIYNALTLLTYPLSALGAFLLVRYLLRNWWLALLGGFIFAFSPWHYVQSLHHLNLAAFQWLPFFVLFFMRAIKEKRLLHLFLAALFLTLASLCSWNFLIFCGYFMVFAYIYLALRRRRLWLPDVAKRAVAIAGVSLLALSVWLVPMILATFGQGGASAPGHNWMVADLAGLILPQKHHLLGSWQPFAAVTATYTGTPWEATTYLGVFVLILVMLNLRRLSSIAAKYLLGALSALVLAWGAHPHIAGWSLPIILPYRIIEHLPFLSNIRAPGRHIIFVYLFLAVLVPLALKLICDRIRNRRLGHVVVAGALLLLLFDYTQICTETTSTEAPQCYDFIKQDQSEFAILDLPLAYTDLNRYMMNQISHGLPIVAGWTSRKLSTTLVDTLEFHDLAVMKQQLVQSKVKYIVVHKENVTYNHPPLISDYYDWFERVYYDDEVLIFQTYK